MRICSFDDRRLGAIQEADGAGRVIDLTELVPVETPAEQRVTALIAAWPALEPKAHALAADGDGVSVAEVVLRSPQPAPGAVLAAPVNYRRHQAEMGGSNGIYQNQEIRTIETYAGFVKASGSVIGPDEPISLPFADRRFDHEAELGVVIGRRAHRVSRADALGHVFGYVPLIDVTMRGQEDRSFRKSFDTFTPIGPAIVTADEVGDPDDLELRLCVNGEQRQHANTADLIYDVARLIELYSSVITLHPGDLIATGTPEGVGPIEPGDTVELSIGRVGDLTMHVSLSGDNPR